MTHIHADVLFDRLFQEVEEYPEGVIGVPREYQDRISGTAFFPGGDGLFKPNGNREIRKSGVLVLGNNFGCWSDFELVKTLVVRTLIATLGVR